ncbi:MAG: gluconokinase [Bryobacterales bacterium]|nr:gluconokinase [Bryobacterales bacterium]
MDSIVTLDVGSSSVRTLLYSFEGREIEGFGSKLEYHARTSEAGAWEIDAAELTGLAARVLTGICAQLRSKGVRPAAVAIDTFWHSILGVDEAGKAVTPVLHPFDSRSSAAAARLATRIDNLAQHARTGCMLHPSYPPAKLLWLAETQPEALAAAKHWMSIGEYLFLQFFGSARASTSMVSASGLWNQNADTWDEEMLSALPIDRDQLADLETLDRPCNSLTSPFREQFPELDGIPWYPALGDGACDNPGSGCTTREQWALMVGTSGAMRVTIDRSSAPGNAIEIPQGLFCYRLDRKRYITGGALSNGGEVYAWMKRNLRLPEDGEIERQLAGMTPGLHGLTMLPLFAGERSPEWRTDVRGAITGLASATTAIEILHAAMESVALRFRNIYEIMEKAFGAPREVIGSGGALLHSAVWTQIMADALGHPVRMCLEHEATSRGAALLALERMGAITAMPGAAMGATIEADPQKKDIYLAALAAQRQLYKRLFE